MPQPYKLDTRYSAYLMKPEPDMAVCE